MKIRVLKRCFSFRLERHLEVGEIIFCPKVPWLAIARGLVEAV